MLQEQSTGDLADLGSSQQSMDTGCHDYAMDVDMGMDDCSTVVSPLPLKKQISEPCRITGPYLAPTTDPTYSRTVFMHSPV